MPIEFGNTENQTFSYVRVHAPSNTWTIKTGDEDTKVDMSKGILIDIKNVKFGWLKIDIGIRDWVEWESTSSPAPKPEDDYKQGFEVTCFYNGVEAVFSNNTFWGGQFIAKLYNQAEKHPEFKSKVPIVKISASTPIKVGKGTSYDLGFTISDWDTDPKSKAQPPEEAKAVEAEVSFDDFK
jgi:hypothetical protein